MKDNDRYTVVADSWSVGIMAFNMWATRCPLRNRR